MAFSKQDLVELNATKARNLRAVGLRWTAPMYDRARSLAGDREQTLSYFLASLVAKEVQGDAVEATDQKAQAPLGSHVEEHCTRDPRLPRSVQAAICVNLAFWSKCLMDIDPTRLDSVLEQAGGWAQMLELDVPLTTVGSSVTQGDWLSHTGKDVRVDLVMLLGFMTGVMADMPTRKRDWLERSALQWSEVLGFALEADTDRPDHLAVDTTDVYERAGA